MIKGEVMGELGYKTRYSTLSLKRKKYVYFSCYPDDFEVYFRSICEEIFQFQNCAIWYNKGPKMDWDKGELNEKLGGMNLFIIPITSRFLHEDNIARDVELPFAMQHNIPVLPLIQEKGLEKELDINCIDNTGITEDITKINYESKLEKSLSSLLIDDDMTEKVRNAFDAYIFMSYRKKDQRYAQELMHLIHCNDFCRDIAIWYDEYLKPGERFNDEIEEAMKKSALFTFVITPNIYGPADDGKAASDLSKPHDNYVVKQEYPIAKETGRPILPAEMLRTNRDLLNAKFDGMPEPVNAHDSNALSKALQEKLQGVAIGKHSSEPEHSFFIGLAYLYGIDVEIDYDRAIQLITSAAEEYLPDAMKMLSQMYKFGYGVEMNSEKSILWLEQIEKYFEEKFNISGSEEDAYRYIQAWEDLGDAWHDMGSLNESKEAYMRMLSLAKQYGGSRSEQIIITGYLKMGIINEECALIDEAKLWFQRGQILGEKLSQDEETTEIRTSMAAIYGRLGEISADEEDYKKAELLSVKSMELYEKLDSGDNSEEAQRNEVGVCCNLGSICMIEGYLDDAEAWCKKALNINKDLIEDTRLTILCIDQMQIYELLIEISWNKGNLVEARNWALECENLSKNIDKENEMALARRHMINIYDWLGKISLAEGDMNDAKKQYLRGLEISEILSQETKIPDIYTEVAMFCKNLGELHMNDGEMYEAEEWYKKALKADEESEKLGPDKESIEALIDRVKIYNNLAEISRKEGEYGKAREWCTRGLDTGNNLGRESTNADARKCLISVYNELGEICQDEGDVNAAKEWFKRGEEITEN